MAANINMAGSMANEANEASPMRPDTSISTKAVDKKMNDHIRPNTKNARQLLKHATVLKNKLLMAGTPCQCTNAGACQNTADNGMYSSNDSHMAF